MRLQLSTRPLVAQTRSLGFDSWQWQGFLCFSIVTFCHIVHVKVRLIHAWYMWQSCVVIPSRVSIALLPSKFSDMALQTQQCDRNMRRSNLRFLHGTATYVLI